MDWLLVFAFPLAVVIGCALMLRNLVRYLEECVAEDRRHHSYGVGEPAPGSIDATLADIAALPETEAA